MNFRRFVMLFGAVKLFSMTFVAGGVWKIMPMYDEGGVVVSQIMTIYDEGDQKICNFDQKPYNV